MNLVNSLLRPLFDGLLFPFRDLSPVIGLAVLSLLTAVALLLVFKRVSDQQGLAAVKRRIHASLFEIRLFNDDLRAMFRAQLQILRHNVTYLRLSSVAVFWTLPPLVLVIAQLQFHYGYRGLDLGHPALVKVTLEEEAGTESKPPLTVAAPPGLRVEDPPVWIPSAREMTWRLIAEAEGDYELRISAGGAEITKTVRVTDRVVRRSPVRVRGSLNELIYPAEPPIPRDSPFESIAVTYPRADVLVFGWALHWTVVYFGLSVLFAIVLRKPFGVIL